MPQNYTAMIIKEGKWYAGSIKELSGCHSQGESREEVLENLKEALQLILEANARHFAEYAKEVEEVQISIAA